jgi:tyrosyl-tRNA synthetase
MQHSFLDELAWRGMLHQSTDGAAAALAAGPLSGYVGFDPTGASLHVGHLLQVMGLVHLQRCGHRPVALVGGATGMIGDPSGRSAERTLLSQDQVAANADAIHRQLERFLDFTGPRAAVMRNNTAWLSPLGVLQFLRDVGKHFGVNYMLAKESVKARLEVGITYTEFSYMLLQAYDFLQLHEQDGVSLQLGGSDQWGNITAGTELIRRSLGHEAFGVTLPLITTADGKKFGKTAEGTGVWLDPARTSPYKFYQFWVNTDDRNASAFLRRFTLLERAAVESLDAELAAHPEQRVVQHTLADDVTTRVHGAVASRLARDASRLVFDRKADPRELPLATLELLRDEIPYHRVPRGAGAEREGVSVVDLLVETGLVKSKSDARRQLQQGAVTVNARRLGADEITVARHEALHDTFFLIRKGGREVALAELASGAEHAR